MSAVGEIEVLRDREVIARFAKSDVGLHIYELGDLDPFFLPSATYYGLVDGSGAPNALALVYRGSDVPTLVALGREGDEAVAELFRRLLPRLEHAVYAHLAPGLAAMVEGRSTRSHGRFLKMVQVEREALAIDGTYLAERLSPGHEAELRALYGAAYGDAWFDPRMLELGQYFGLRDAGALVAVAGVHVSSREHGVAAIGNVATLPSHRAKGLAKRVVARLCQSLLDDGIFTIGLNVKADNAPAIACYERLGFAAVAPYEEWSIGAP